MPCVVRPAVYHADLQWQFRPANQAPDTGKCQVPDTGNERNCEWAGQGAEFWKCGGTGYWKYLGLGALECRSEGVLVVATPDRCRILEGFGVGKLAVAGLKVFGHQCCAARRGCWSPTAPHGL